MLELLNQLDGFSSDERIKVFISSPQIGGNFSVIVIMRMVLLGPD